MCDARTVPKGTLARCGWPGVKRAPCRTGRAPSMLFHTRGGRNLTGRRQRGRVRACGGLPVGVGWSKRSHSGGLGRPPATSVFVDPVSRWCQEFSLWARQNPARMRRRRLSAQRIAVTSIGPVVGGHFFAGPDTLGLED